LDRTATRADTRVAETDGHKGNVVPPLVCPCSLLAPPPTVRFLQSAAEEEEKEEIIDAAERPFDLTVARSASRGQTLSSGEETDELFDAAAAGDQERVVALLAAGADVDQARTATDTPAWAASLNPDGSKMGAVVAALLKATALLVASANGHAPVVKLLLAAGAAVDQTDDDGRTAVFLASLFGVVAVVAMLIAAGANVDLAMKNGATPLYVACQNGHADVARLLLVHKASVDLAMKNGATPLFTACEEGHLDVVALLVCAGADLRPMLKGKGFELKRPTGGAYEACVLYMDENFRTFFCASAKDAADAKAIPVEGIIGASAVDGSDVAFRITSLTGAALDLEAPSPKLRDALVLGLNKLFALETEAAAERDRHFKSIGFFPSDVLRTPAHINPAIFASFMRWKCKTTEAARGTQFWADSTDSEGGTFRDANGVLIADEAVLRMEKDLKAAAEAEDADFKVANLHGMAVRLDFLLALTFMLDLWDWKTWEVRVFTLAPVGRSPPPPISLGVAPSSF
jgi:ankyrin repeat protein